MSATPTCLVAREELFSSPGIETVPKFKNYNKKKFNHTISNSNEYK